MPLLSKSEIQFLQGQKQVSKSYEYKLKSIIKKKVSNLMEKEIPLINPLFTSINLTEFGKYNHEGGVEAIKEKLHSPVKHCGISSRRSRVQIPAGAHFSIENNNNNIIPKDRSISIKTIILVKIRKRKSMTINKVIRKDAKRLNIER
jgi:hypothetical protein